MEYVLRAAVRFREEINEKPLNFTRVLHVSLPSRRSLVPTFVLLPSRVSVSVVVVFSLGVPLIVLF